MKLTIEHYNKVITIEEADDLDIYQLAENVIRPAILAIGFHPDNVEQILPTEERISLQTTIDAWHKNGILHADSSHPIGTLYIDGAVADTKNKWEKITIILNDKH